MKITAKNFKKKITPIILCGGKGERLKPLTIKTPKPLLKINGNEILSYIIKHLLFYKLENILVLSGYKKYKIKEFLQKNFKNKTSYLDTGLNRDILQRIKIAEKHCLEYILICYGDTLVNLDVNKLIKFHLINKADLSLSVYNQKISFGVVNIDESNNIKSFKEKPNLENWINIGFILVKKKKFFNISKKYKTFKSFL